MGTFNSLLLILLITPLMLFGCAQTSGKQAKVKTLPAADHVTGLKPLSPQPGAADIEPGLKVWYFTDFYIHRIAAMPQGKPPFSWGKPGKAIPYLNHHFLGENRKKLNVFDSGTHRGVAMYMWGLIKFPSKGRYLMKSMVNDGIIVLIDDKVVINDPSWGGDRFSRETIVDISQPGWYKIVVKYFQRKGTARIHLYWRRPEKKNCEFIPPQFYAHLKEISG